MIEKDQQDHDPRRLLAQAIANEVVQGYRVESQSDIQAILVKGGNVNHTFHLIVTLVTCGWWGIGWLAIWAINKEKRLSLTIDPYGHVLRSELG